MPRLQVYCSASLDSDNNSSSFNTGDLHSHCLLSSVWALVPGPPPLLPPRRISECCLGRRLRGRWGVASPVSLCPSSSSTWRTPAPALCHNREKETHVTVSGAAKQMLRVNNQLTSTPLELRFKSGAASHRDGCSWSEPSISHSCAGVSLVCLTRSENLHSDWSCVSITPWVAQNRKSAIQNWWWKRLHFWKTS